MKTRVVILGGGPSGLGAALELAKYRNYEVHIVEKAEKLGGLSGSFDVDNVPFDYGPHRFSPEFPDLVELFQKLLGSDFLEVKNEHAVAFKERMYRYPPKISEFLNAQSLKYSMRVMGSAAMGRMPNPNLEKSFKNEIIRKFGERLYDDVVEPLCQKVWGDPREFAPEFATLRFSVPTFVSWGKRLVSTKKNARDKVFYYPKNGFQQLWDRLGEHLIELGVKISTSSSVCRLEFNDNQISAVTIQNSGRARSLACDWLVSTIPIQSLNESMSLDPMELKPFRDKGMVLVSFILNRAQCLPARVVIFPETKFSFNRLSEQSQFSPFLLPKGQSLIHADILTEENSEFWRLSDESIIDKVKGQILGLDLFNETEILKCYVNRIPMAYPMPTKTREEAQRKFNEMIFQYSNLICTGRFSTSDYNNSHTALKRGMASVKRITENLSLERHVLETERLRSLPIRD